MDVDVLLGNKPADANTPLPAHLRVIKRIGVGDALHVDSLVATAAEEESVGTERGSKDKEVYSATQAVLGASYYERAQDRHKVAIRKEEFHGAPVSIVKAAVKQVRSCVRACVRVYITRTRTHSHTHTHTHTHTHAALVHKRHRR